MSMYEYCPNVSVFWNAIRARNFVKALGFKSGKFSDNMETLARKAGVHVKQMGRVNPLTFAEREGIPRYTVIRILGEKIISELKQELHQRWTWSSSLWAYHNKQPIPAYRESPVPMVQPETPPVNTPPPEPEPDAKASDPSPPSPVPSEIKQGSELNHFLDISESRIPVRDPLPAVQTGEWLVERKKMNDILLEIKSHTKSGEEYTKSLSKLFNFIVLDIAFFMRHPPLHAIAKRKVEEAIETPTFESIHRLMTTAKYSLDRSPVLGSQCVITTSREPDGRYTVGILTNVLENRMAVVNVGNTEVTHCVYDILPYGAPSTEEIALESMRYIKEIYDDHSYCSQCGDEGCQMCEGYDSYG